MLSLHAPNADRLVAAGGLEFLLQLLRSHVVTDLLDAEKETQIQANAANAIANVIASFGEKVSKAKSLRETWGLCSHYDSPLTTSSQSLTAVVALCGAHFQTARRAAALLIGNLALDPDLRSQLGQSGAVEALWATCMNNLKDASATALWALSNLVWSNRANQERCGVFLESAVSISYSHRDDHTSAAFLEGLAPLCGPLERTCALQLVANALYFNEPNRMRVESSPDSLDKLVALAGPNEPMAVQEQALRCLVSITSTGRGTKLVALASHGRRAYKTFARAAGDHARGGGTHLQQLGASALANLSAALSAAPDQMLSFCSVLVTVIAHPSHFRRVTGGVDTLILTARVGDKHENSTSFFA
mmetsp:Transcript_4719/g.15028  ORF Transcript_4719/g.15028 Transcript_4719/m.15028 type:complete len:361 (+) Transcript_4719:3631-4713(+)